ncbi:ATP synthase F1 subunit delta [Ravibacter arvi]|uniref:ATP synthase subunit delta n=1 Tax=Ravibacter arvi TaxID=2051041 RepID=A0ABP8MAS2_9BACT
MSISTVASRYAKSLIELAKEKNVVDEVYQDMVLFSKTADESPLLMKVLGSPIVRHEKKLGILKGLFQDKVNPVSFSIFNIITRKNREAILDAIADEFVKQYDLYKGIQKATVVSSTSLTPEVRKQFIDSLTASTGKTIQLEEKVDESLVGGYILRLGDRQVDASLKSQLNALKVKLVS